MSKAPGHTDNLKPIFIDQEKKQFSEWDVRRAWDNALSGTTMTGPIGEAFHSYAFRAFLTELKGTVDGSDTGESERASD